MARVNSSFGPLQSAWGGGAVRLPGSPFTPDPPDPPIPAARPAAPEQDSPSSTGWVENALSQPHADTATVPWVMAASHLGHLGHLPSLFQCDLLGSASDPNRVYRIDPVAVANLDEIERRCRLQAPRILVLDLELARETGPEGLHRFKRRLARSDLVLATNTSSKAIDTALLHHVRGCIDWSLPREQLMHALDAVLEGELWFARAVMQALYLSLLADYESSPGQANAIARSVALALTPRELKALALMRQGMSNREIAERLGISVNTVKKHLVHVFEKRGLRGRRQEIEG